MRQRNGPSVLSQSERVKAAQCFPAELQQAGERQTLKTMKLEDAHMISATPSAEVSLDYKSIT